MGSSGQGRDDNAIVKAYTYSRNQKNYALLTAIYPGTGVLLLIIVPSEEYQSAQSWIMPAITGVKIKK